MKTNFKNSNGIISELESAVDDVKRDPDSIKIAQTRITGCKHAIQVFALSMAYAQVRNIKNEKLKALQLED